MKWIRGDDWHLCSDPPGFTVAKALVGGRVCYTAFKRGKPWPLRAGESEPRGYDGSTILHAERDLDPADEPALIAAMRRCKAACEAVR